MRPPTFVLVAGVPSAHRARWRVEQLAAPATTGLQSNRNAMAGGPSPTPPISRGRWPLLPTSPTLRGAEAFPNASDVPTSSNPSSPPPPCGTVWRRGTHALLSATGGLIHEIQIVIASDAGRHFCSFAADVAITWCFPFTRSCCSMGALLP